MSNQGLPAPWFYESQTLDSTGAPVMEGPYTAKEILKFIMDGVLKVESRIYDVENNVWAVASDVVPQIGSDDVSMAPTEPVFEQVAAQIIAPAAAEEIPASSNWAPPPRPIALKDTHVVDLHGENTGQVDYLALISKAKRPGEVAQAGYRPITANSQTPKSVKNVATVNVKTTTTPDQDLASELAGATDALRTAGNFFKGHQRAIFTAASLALVFAGSFGLFKSMSSDKNRSPATSGAQPLTETSREEAKRSAAKVTPEPIQMKGSSEIGSGHARVTRHSGGVNNNYAPAPMQAAITNQNNVPVNNTPPPEPSRQQDNNGGNNGGSPQFYSSTDDDPNRGVANVDNNGAPPAQPPQAQDPGAVMPPGYMPPPTDPAANGAPPSSTF